ncbi:PIN domain-containing protein [Brevibacillus fluminis]|uniref:PIN domain-containing protein n=1 Tax=Brevibacillus fluminis TaxID=511487 RepID=UPI003F8A243F
MHFFLDSTVFKKGKDVFLNNNFSNEFLNICQTNNFKIYISEVVIQEIKRQYQEFISSQIKNATTAFGVFNQFRGKMDFSYIPNINEAIDTFDNYFKSLEQEGIIHIVPFSNDFLPELIHRSIYRIRPFTETKQEFRDAVIWFSYAKLAEEQNLDGCFFICGNTNDYLDKNGQMHPALIEKSSRFTLIRDIYNLLNEPFMKPYKTTHHLLVSLREKFRGQGKLIEDYLNEIQTRKLIDQNINEYVMDYEDIRFVYDILKPTGINITSVDYINQRFIVSGDFNVNASYVSLNGQGSVKIKLHFDAVYDPTTSSFSEIEFFTLFLT